MKTKSRIKTRNRERSSYAVRLTSKFQATIPKEIREHLNLKKGDEVLYELLPDNTVVVRRTSPLDLNYLQALNSTLSEPRP